MQLLVHEFLLQKFQMFDSQISLYHTAHKSST
jgi:hypothetical protein